MLEWRTRGSRSPDDHHQDVFDRNRVPWHGFLGGRCQALEGVEKHGYGLVEVRGGLCLALPTSKVGRAAA